MRPRTDRVPVPGLLAALLVTFTVVPAAHAFPMPRPGLELTLSGSRSWYPEAAVGVSDLIEDKVAAGYAVGGTIEWQLAGPLALESGLRYSLDTERRDTSADPFLSGFSATMRTRLHRLGVPLRLRLGLPFARGLSAEVGAETQYLLLARRADEVHHGGGIIFMSAPGAGRVARPNAIIFEAYTGEDDITSLYPRWNPALGGGLGWEFPLGRVMGTLRGRYQQGISDQTKTPYAKDFSRVGELGFGVRW